MEHAGAGLAFTAPVEFHSGLIVSFAIVQMFNMELPLFGANL